MNTFGKNATTTATTATMATMAMATMAMATSSSSNVMTTTAVSAFDKQIQKLI